MRWRIFLERAFPPFGDRKREKPREMLYVAAERPGWPVATVGGAQHALVALRLVIYTVIIGQALELPEAQLRGFVSLEIIVMGLATLLQSMTTRLSAGLRVILKALKLLKQRGKGAIALRNANEQIQEVLEITGFLTMLKCHASLDEAIRDVSG